jgi:hypothetical protein
MDAQRTLASSRIAGVGNGVRGRQPIAVYRPWAAAGYPEGMDFVSAEVKDELPNAQAGGDLLTPRRWNHSLKRYI